MNSRNLFLALTFLAIASLLSGCTLTPHANVGVNFHMNDGKLKAKPHADIGVYVRP